MRPLAVAALFAFQLSAAINLHPEGPRRLWKEVHLTSRWTGPDVRYPATLAFRLDSNRLLVKAVDPHFSESRECRAVDLRTAHSRECRSGEWHRATPVATHTVSPFRPLPKLYGDVWKHKGAVSNTDRPYALSPDGNWLAIMSWSGKRRHISDLSIAPDFTIPRGRLYIEVYKVSTGSLFTSLSGPFLAEEPFDILDNVVWLSDRHLMVPTRKARSIWLLDLRPAEAPEAAAWDFVRPGIEILGFIDHPETSGDVLDSAVRSVTLRIPESAERIGGSWRPVPGQGPGLAFGEVARTEPRAPVVTIVRAGELVATAGPAELGPVQELPPNRQTLSERPEWRMQPRFVAPTIVQGAPPQTNSKVKGALTGANRFELIDANHNGRAEFLYVELGVDSNLAGCTVLAGLWKAVEPTYFLDMVEMQYSAPGKLTAYISSTRFRAGGVHVLKDFVVRCGGLEQAWVSSEVQTPSIDSRWLEDPFRIEIAKPVRVDDKHVEYRVDCLPVASYPLSFEFVLARPPLVQASIEPASGPCVAGAARIRMETAGLAPGRYAIVLDVRPPGGVVHPEYWIYWTAVGELEVAGIFPTRGSGRKATFHVAARDSSGSWDAIESVELLFNDHPAEDEGYLIKGSTNTFNVEFAPRFSGPKNVYARVTNIEGRSTGWVQKATWTVSDNRPEAVGVIPYISADATRTFTFAFADRGGASGIAHASFLFGPYLDRALGCSFDWERDAGAVTLSGGGSIRAGSTESTENPRCRLSNVTLIEESRVSLLLRIKVEFLGPLDGRRNIYVKVDGRAGETSWWRWLGSHSLTARASSPPAL